MTKNINKKLEDTIIKDSAARKKELTEMNSILKEIGEATDDYRKTGAERRKAELEQLLSVQGMAQEVTTALGQKEGITRAITTGLTNMMDSPAIRGAVKGGDSLVKEELMSKMLETLIDSPLMQDTNSQQIMEDIWQNMEQMDWKSMASNAENIMWGASESFKAAAASMRHTIVDKFPLAARVLSDAMIEHYKQGFNKAFGAFKDQAKDILSPIMSVIGPVLGVVQGLWIIGKTLLTESTKYEESTAHWTQRTAEAMERLEGGQAAKDKRELFGSKKKKGFLGSIEVFLGDIAARFGLAGAGGLLGAAGSLLMSGLILGLIVYMIYEYVQGFKSGDNLGDSVVKGAAAMLEPLLMIPEFFINKMLEHIFETDFRVDFSSEAIEKAINDFNDWLYKNFTEPFLDFFIIDLPNFFTETLSWDNLSKMMYDTAKEAGVPDWMLPDSMSPTGTEQQPSPEKAPITYSDANSGYVLRAGLIGAQTTSARDAARLLGDTNNNLKTTNTSVNNMGDKVANAVVVQDSSKDIPTNTEDLGIMALGLMD